MQNSNERQTPEAVRYNSTGLARNKAVGLNSIQEYRGGFSDELAVFVDVTYRGIKTVVPSRR